MRAGLLTRMLGYLGIAAGAMLVLFPLPIVQVFWLAALGVLLLGRWPGGEPPAWRSGQAEPWPAPSASGGSRAAAAGRGRTRSGTKTRGDRAGSARRKRKKRH